MPSGLEVNVSEKIFVLHIKIRYAIFGYDIHTEAKPSFAALALTTSEQIDSI